MLRHRGWSAGPVRSGHRLLPQFVDGHLEQVFKRELRPVA